MVTVEIFFCGRTHRANIKGRRLTNQIIVGNGLISWRRVEGYALACICPPCDFRPSVPGLVNDSLPLAWEATKPFDGVRVRFVFCGL